MERSRCRSLAAAPHTPRCPSHPSPPLRHPSLPIPHPSLAHTALRAALAPRRAEQPLCFSVCTCTQDELAFLPWYTLLVQACPQGSLCDQSLGALRPAALAALERTARIVRPLRSSLWSAIRLAVSTDAADHDDALRSLRWNLRSWPLELVDWPVSNSHRIDLVYERGADRFHKAHSDSWHVRSPLPANERRQMRWNANPFEVADGGDGLSEGDPGAWLLPYWMGRAIGVLSAEE